MTNGGVPLCLVIRHYSTAENIALLVLKKWRSIGTKYLLSLLCHMSNILEIISKLIEGPGKRKI
jgi:hypothetical protein